MLRRNSSSCSSSSGRMRPRRRITINMFIEAKETTVGMDDVPTRDRAADRAALQVRFPAPGRTQMRQATIRFDGAAAFC